jgi:osmotically inducible protein OsmC
MSISNELVLAGNPAPTSVDTTAEVTFQPGQGITGIKLTCSVAVPGVDQDKFDAAAEAAKKNCPVSRALAATPITYDVSLAES